MDLDDLHYLPVVQKPAPDADLHRSRVHGNLLNSVRPLSGSVRSARNSRRQSRCSTADLT